MSFGYTIASNNGQTDKPKEQCNIETGKLLCKAVFGDHIIIIK